MIFRNIALGLSGGVDSAVTAYLLKQKGFNVSAFFMKNWDERDERGFCSSDNDFEDAQYISNHLQIPLQQINYVKEYWTEVFSEFINEYQEGITPNPDILCNRKIKFKMFHKHVIETLGFDAIATGHYAQTSFGPFLENYKDGMEVKLIQAADSVKDQTFFLSQVSQSSLRRCMFPIGSLNKHQVKEIANKIGLQKIAKRKESMGICFIGNRTFQNFINEYIDEKPGNFVDIDTGKIVGTHQGVHCWTLGQRCRIKSALKAFFVYRKEPKTATIFVAAGTDNKFLWSDILYTEKPFWIRKCPLEQQSLLICQFRFQHVDPLINCTIYKSNAAGDKLLVKLDEPQRSITPGQYAVFYKDGECLGSSRIIDSSPSLINFQ